MILTLFNAGMAYDQSKRANDYALKDWERRLQYQKDVYAAQDRAATVNMRQVRNQAAQQRQATFERAHQLRSHLRAAAGESIGYGGTYQAVARQGSIDAARAFGALKANEVGALRSVRSRSRQIIDIGSPPQLTNPGMDAFMAGANTFLGGVGAILSAVSGGVIPGDLLQLGPEGGGSGVQLGTQGMGSSGPYASGSAGTGGVSGSVSGGIGGSY